MLRKGPRETPLKCCLHVKPNFHGSEIYAWLVSCVFRRKFVAGLRSAFHRGELQFYDSLLSLAEPRAFASWLRVLFHHDWVIYSKWPFGGPEHVALTIAFLGAPPYLFAKISQRTRILRRNTDT
jgi:hypothetical protein